MSEPIVKTKNGPLRGELLRSVENCEYYAFKGIPYAKPPVKELRFKDPEPVENWSHVRDATKCGDVCFQYDSTSHSFVGSEDCLYLNVYTRTIENIEILKPVMMFIHGSGFSFGSGSDINYGPDYLIKKDIVLVTINHRLGVFGFLNLEDEICPGNQGLKDIVMALKWIHNNIQNFGGDPKNITAFGESAGGFCAHSLALSPMSKGLVHKIICQSGTAANVWNRVHEPKKYVLQLCTSLGKVILKPKLVFEFLRNMDGNRLIKAQEKLRKQIADSNKHQSIDLPFGPGVDCKSPNPFMPVPIEEAMLQALDIPFLVGYNSFEGTCFLLDQINFTPIKDSDFIGFDLNFNSIVPKTVKQLLQNYNMTVSDLKRMYFKDKKITAAEWENVAHMQGDLYIFHGIYKSIEVQVNSKNNQTYFYKFSFDQDVTLMKLKHKFKFSGATHFDELTYLFYNSLYGKLGFPPLKENKKGYKVMKQMTEMWTNFAKYGNPTPKVSELLPVIWKPVDSAVDIPYLNIDEEMSMETTSHIDEKFKMFKLMKD